MKNKGKVNFYQRCADIKKQTAKIEYSIYSEYSRLKFAKLCQIYDDSQVRNNSSEIEQTRS